MSVEVEELAEDVESCTGTASPFFRVVAVVVEVDVE